MGRLGQRQPREGRNASALTAELSTRWAAVPSGQTLSSRTGAGRTSLSVRRSIALTSGVRRPASFRAVARLERLACSTEVAETVVAEQTQGRRLVVGGQPHISLMLS